MTEAAPEPNLEQDAARQYVETALRGRAGLDRAIDIVLAQVLSDLARPSADLSDDDVERIRQTCDLAGKETCPSPIEALVHVGLICKRSREQGGGYRFFSSAVARYLIFRHLAQGRPAQEEESAYWARRAAPAPVFPEYAGAFAFLIRDWAGRDRLNLAGPLAEAAAPWLGGVFIEFLVEQARADHVPGQGSPSASAAAQALAQTGLERSAAALDEAGYQLMESPFALSSTFYFQACVSIRELLWTSNPNQVDTGDRLGRALNNLGLLLRTTGHEAETERVFRRSAEIYEAMWAANLNHLNIGAGLGRTLNNLGLLLYDAGREDVAEQAFRRSVQIWESLRAADPDVVGLGVGLGRALSNLGNLLSDGGRGAEAEEAYRRSIQIEEVLWTANADLPGIGAGLGATMNCLGILLSEAGRCAEAEKAYRRSLEIYEALWSAHPENVGIGAGLAGALNSLGILMSEAGRAAEAEQTFRQSVKIYEALWTANPDHVDVAAGLENARNNLGVLLNDTEQDDKVKG